MKIRTILLAGVLAGIGFPSTVWANCKLGDCVSGTAGTAMFSVMSMHDMVGKRWVIEVAPGYFSGQFGVDQPGHNMDVKGWASAFAIKREFTAHWGAGIIGGLASQSGESTITRASGQLAPDLPASMGPGLSGGNSHPGGTFKNIKATLFGLMLTFDPFANPDGFRMPISAGPIWFTQGVDFENIFTNPDNGKAQKDSFTLERKTQGLFANVSFDFLFWDKVRLMPGFTVGGSLSASNFLDFEYVVVQDDVEVGRFAHNTSFQPFFAVIYVSVLYRPLGLSFNYKFISNDQSNKIYALKWTKKFGG